MLSKKAWFGFTAGMLGASLLYNAKRTGHKTAANDLNTENSDRTVSDASHGSDILEHQKEQILKNVDELENQFQNVQEMIEKLE